MNKSDMLNEKAEQLADFLDIKMSDIEISYHEGFESNAEFMTPDGTFTVMTEDEAKSANRDNIDEKFDGYTSETKDFYIFQQSDTDDRSCSLIHSNEQNQYDKAG